MTVEEDRTPTVGFRPGTISHDAAWSLGYATVVRLATLAVSIAIARLAGPAGNGALGVALQVTALGSMLAGFSLPQSLARHLAASNDPLMDRRLLTTSALMILISSMIVGSGIAIVSPWLGRQVYRDDSLVPVLLWCGPLVVATASMSWVEGALQGLRRFPELTRWGAAVSLLDLTLGVAAAPLGVVWLIASRAVIRVGAIMAAAIRLFRTPQFAAPSGHSDHLATAGPLLSFAAPALLSGAIILGSQTALRLLLVRSAGIGAAGHFHAADSIAQGLLLIPGAASIALMRSVASKEATGYAGLSDSLRHALERVVGWNIPLSLAVIGCVPWALPTIFGGGFASAAPVLTLLAVGYGLSGLCLVFGAILLGRGEVWAGVIFNLVWSAVVLVTFRFGGARFGAAGAALAVTVGYAVTLVLLLVLVVPRWATPRRTLMPVTLATFASLGVGCLMALNPAIPAPAVAAVCLAMGLALFARWGWTRSARSGPPTELR